MSEPNLPLALKLAGHGWYILPLSPASKRPLANCPACHHGTRCGPGYLQDCPCLPMGRWCHAAHAATTDPARIRAWWQREPAAIPGVAAGPSQLVLLDLDTHTDDPPKDPATALLPGIDLTAEDLPTHRWRDPTPAGPAIRDGRDTLHLLAQLRGGPHPWPTDPQHRPVTVATEGPH